ncbi:Uncharacterised protein [Bordetella pertussis]|nr:Uncharacterised protein [Bordetella pertussis]
MAWAPASDVAVPTTVAPRAASSWAMAGSVMAMPVRSASMRLVRPVSTLPGPHSITWVTPSSFIARSVSTQRTGCHAWRTSASRMAAGSAGVATSTLLSTGTCGADTSTPASAPCSTSAAGLSRLE